MSTASTKKEIQKDLAALTAGAACPLAFAPFEAIPLAYVSLAVLFVAWRDAGPGRDALRGLLFGIGQFTVGVYWIHVCLRDYAGSTELAALLITAGCILILATFPAFAGFLGALLARSHPAVRLMVVYPGSWILAEWLRAWLGFPGFPWLQIGYSQIDAVPAALAPVLGVYGVGFMVASSVGALLYALESEARARVAALCSLALVWGLAGYFYRYPWTHPTGDPFKVALLQGNIQQQFKWRPEIKHQTLRWYIDTSRQHWDADLIVWPETAVPMSYHTVAPVLDQLGREALENGSDLLIGLPIRDLEQQRKFNGIVALGAAEGQYLKRHLVPFGEYLPLQPLSGYVAQYMDFPQAGFTPGAVEQPPIRAAGLPLGASICYEDVFGQEMLEAMPQALYLVNITNDGWFGESIALDQNLQIARLRSLETGRFMARTANTGLTAILSEFGEIVTIAPPGATTVLTGEVRPMAGLTPYMLWGDNLILSLIALSLILVGIPEGRRRMTRAGLLARRG